MLIKSPSGALSPYYYKGGFFHGIHYGGYLDDACALLSMMNEEETFILKSPERRRILIDLYETNLTEELTAKIAQHVQRLSPRIVKLAISSDEKSLRQLRRALNKAASLEAGQLCFSTDMEAAKTWLVSDSFLPAK